MKVIPTIHLELRTDSARQMFTVSLAALSDSELKFLAETFANAGLDVEFGFGLAEDGRQCMQFTIGKATEANNA